jgi:Reverse transcriptase (RNA-dependent DNA polymerase)
MRSSLPARNYRKRKRHLRSHIQGNTKEIVIQYTSRKTSTVLPRTFRGAVTDTGAPRSVIGVREAKLYCEEHGTKFSPRQSSESATVVFRFGNSTSPSLGLMRIAIPAPHGPLMVDVHIVALDIPFLIGLDILSEQGIDVSASRRALVWHRTGDILPLHHDGHLVLKWEPTTLSCFYSASQIRRLHQHFLHPSATRLHSLLRRARPDEMNPMSMELIESITKSCSTCAEFKAKPITFKVRDIDDIVFNQQLLLDLFFIDRRPVLHVVDRGTRFSAARFLRSESAEHVWEAFVKSWSSLYIGHPESMLTDQGSVFMSAQWKGLCHATGIELHHTGVESHSSLNVGEQRHSPLRQTYLKVKHEHPDIEDDLALAISNQAINDMPCAKGISPTLLVFGTTPRIPDERFLLPKQLDRMKAMMTARAAYEKILARRRVEKGLRHAPPAAANSTVSPGSMVYVYRERPKKWAGPVPVLHRNEKHILVAVDGLPKSFNLSQVRSADIDDPNPLAEDGLESPTWITEIISKKDPRANFFGPAIRKEILGLIDKGTFRLALRAEADDQAPNILPSRFVLAIKTSETGDEIYKARLVVGGHRDRLKPKLVHNSTTVSQTSVRMTMTVAALFGFTLWSSDVRQAYLQSAVPLMRDVFLKPDCLELNQDELVKILKPLYGLSDSGDYWHETLRAFHLDHLHMEQLVGDHSCYFRRIADKLVGLSSSYVDDLLHAGTPEFRDDITRMLKDNFEIRIEDAKQFTFAGVDVCSKPYALTQSGYIKRLSKLKLCAKFEDYRSARAKIAWLVQTRPDICCAVATAAQVTDKTFTVPCIRSLNKLVHRLQQTDTIGLQFPTLDQESLTIVCYTDSSFANNVDGSTQLGFIVALTDRTRKCCLISYRSYKARRIVRSSTAGETLAFADGFDAAFIIRRDLESILARHVPLIMLTDSTGLFSTLTKDRYTKERRLLLDIAAVREAYMRKDLANIGLIASCHNIADSMTKLAPNQSLSHVMQSGVLSHPVEEWVEESDIRRVSE